MPSSGCQTCRSEEHTSELQSHSHLVCRLLLEKKERRVRSEEHTSELQTHSHLGCRPVLYSSLSHAVLLCSTPVCSSDLIVSFFFFFKGTAPPRIPPSPHTGRSSC